ncbi:unnamed protein product, partial [Closterium sp. NIES-53]
MGESVFIKNNATKAGGGVAVLEQVEGEISGSRFEGNYAVVGGAGVYLMRSAAATTAAAVGGDRPPQAGASASASGRGKRARGRIALASSSRDRGSGSGGSSSSSSRGSGVRTATSAAAFTPNGTSTSTTTSSSSFSTNHMRLQGLLFDGNSAMDAHGVAFFDASYSPHLRSACHACQMRQQGDTQGSMPADFYLKWPGAAASSQETGGSFSVVGSVGSMLTGLQVVVVDEFGNIVSK